MAKRIVVLDARLTEFDSSSVDRLSILEEQRSCFRASSGKVVLA
jgi:hypothetical protein